MHRPPSIMGELDVWNWGNAPGKSSLRHNTLPLEASKQERTPLTPSVTTFPSATVGELLGPGKVPSAVGRKFWAFLSCQSSLPLAASRQRRISSLLSR